MVGFLDLNSEERIWRTALNQISEEPVLVAIVKSNKNWRIRIAAISRITDVYTLNNFPNLKSFLNECKENEEIYGKTYSMLTGDFLAPYLLSCTGPQNTP